MKVLVSTLFFLVNLFVVFSQNSTTKICNVFSINDLLNSSKNDSIQKIERLAALKFHILINNYRLKNGLDTIGWDEGLWLTCRNHNLWMASNSDLTHKQLKNTKFFIGEEPNNRYDYTTLNKGNCRWSGENALYNFNSDGRNIVEITDNISTKSFEQWKNSPGHNRNMLGESHKVHGVAFLLKSYSKEYYPTTIVWGTDLFSFNQDGQFNHSLSPVNPSNLTLFKSNILRKSNVKLDLRQLESELLQKLYSSYCDKIPGLIEINKAMEKASLNHSVYMSTVKQLTHNEVKTKRNFYGQNAKQRMIKATYGLFYLSKNKSKLIESIAVIESDIKTLDIEKLVDEIQTKLDLDKKTSSNNSKMGYGIILKQNKNSLNIYATRILGD